MKRHGNLFDQAFSVDNLYAAYLDARQGKRMRRACFWFDTRAGAVLDWLRGTTLLPYLAPLTAEAQAQFLAALAPQLAEAYPGDAAGTTLFPFRRIFLVACL